MVYVATGYRQSKDNPVPSTNSMAAAVVHRNNTIPMTKRESVVISGSRTSLLSNGSTQSRIRVETVTVEKKLHKVIQHDRDDKPVKRADSYRLATKRQSVYDELENIQIPQMAKLSVPKNRTRNPPSRNPETVEYRKKYNTLTHVEDTKASGGTLGLSNTGDSNDQLQLSRTNSRSTYSRVSGTSQRSGTYPSPDTDEDQRVVQPERKKKSAFRRMKERLIQTFSNGRGNGKEKGGQSKSTFNRVRPDSSSSKQGYSKSNVNVQDDSNNMTVSRRVVLEGQRGRDQVSDSKTSSKASMNSQKSNYSHGEASSSSLKAERGRDRASASQHKSSPPSQAADDSVNLDETGAAITNPVTQFFGNLIDAPLPKGSGDRSRLELPGLRKNRPKSFERPSSSPPPSQAEKHSHDRGRVIFKNSSSTITSYSNTRNGQKVQLSFQRALSSEVECDGLDYTDNGGEAALSDENDIADVWQNGQLFDECSEQERHRRVIQVGQCLKAIADRLTSEVTDRNDGVTGIRVGTVPTAAEHHSMVAELRSIGDQVDKQYFSNWSPSVIPWNRQFIQQLVVAKTYQEFKKVLQRELSATVGWEQVAWYTLVTKAAVDMGGAGLDLGKKIKDRALRFFDSKFRPFVESQPSGWESVTDIDSELD